MEKRENAEKHLYELKKRIVNYVKQTPDLLLNGTENPARTAPHIVNFSFPGMKSEVLLHALEEHGVYVSTRSACSSGDDKPSRVLTAMGCDGERATSAVRISLVPELEISDIDALTDRLNRVVQTFRRHTGKKEGHL